jgi:hypothetical protein
MNLRKVEVLDRKDHYIQRYNSEHLESIMR